MDTLVPSYVGILRNNYKEFLFTTTRTMESKRVVFFGGSRLNNGWIFLSAGEHPTLPPLVLTLAGGFLEILCRSFW